MKREMIVTTVILLLMYSSIMNSMEAPEKKKHSVLKHVKNLAVLNRKIRQHEEELSRLQLKQMMIDSNTTNKESNHIEEQLQEVTQRLAVLKVERDYKEDEVGYQQKETAVNKKRRYQVLS